MTARSTGSGQHASGAQFRSWRLFPEWPAKFALSSGGTPISESSFRIWVATWIRVGPQHSRALMTFWNIQQAGRAGIIAHVRRHTDLARYLQERIEARPDLELVAAGPLPAVCFRVVPEELRGDEAGLNRYNLAVMERLQVEGRAFLGGVEIHAFDEAWTGREVGGRYALRYCNLHHALTEDDVEAIVAEVCRVAALCLAEEIPVRL